MENPQDRRILSLSGLALVGLIHAGQGAAAAAARSVVRQEGWAPLVLLGLGAVLAWVGAVALYRSPRTGLARHRIAVLVAVVTTFSLRYAIDLERYPDATGAMPSLAVERPRVETESYPGRPRVQYRINASGFRGDELPGSPRQDGPRCCVIGDSYVFGSGVEEDGTLSASLERALHSEVEVLNLGVRGHNMSSHIALSRRATSVFECDVIVLALTLPNDLATWDINEEIRARSEVSWYSLVALLASNDVAALLFNTGALPQTMGEPERRQLAHSWAELRRAHRVPTLVFTYAHGRAVRGLPAIDDTLVVEAPAYDAAHFIENDGHPTREGNAAFAAVIASAIEGDARFSSQLTKTERTSSSPEPRDR